MAGRLDIVVFQFHYGTTGTNSGRTSQGYGKLFQFHYGTTGTNAMLEFASLLVVNFNSTMVRLELWHSERNPDPLVIFQFHYGTTGTPVRGRLSPFIPHFNSTMVRLELDITQLEKSDLIKFQFHYGTTGTYLEKWKA